MPRSTTRSRSRCCTDWSQTIPDGLERYSAHPQGAGLWAFPKPTAAGLLPEVGFRHSTPVLLPAGRVDHGQKAHSWSRAACGVDGIVSGGIL